MGSQRLSVAMSALILLMLSISLATEAKLNQNYYAKSCPNVAKIVREVVYQKQRETPTTAPGALRIFFHDCFVGGCDSSVLITSNNFNRHAERDADINLSLPGDAFDVVNRAKAALELECPGVVSCADILTLATRDGLSMLGGPFVPVRLGRKDALASTAASVDANLPRSNHSVTEILNLFTSKGFTAQEVVALTGAHTVGFSHCSEYADRIYNYKKGVPNSFDPSMDPRYAAALQKACENYKKDDTIATFNDIMTPGTFDNKYFQNIKRGLALLASDHALTADPRTASFVNLYAANQTLFFNDFIKAFQKLSVYGVKTGRKGEVRRRCDQFNNIGV